MIKDIQTQQEKPNPNNEIDFQNQTTSPFISSEFVSDRLRNKFRIIDIDKESGNYVVLKDYWANLEVFTQDWRLGNIVKEEAFYIRYNLDLSQDILTALPSEFSKCALMLLERSISVNETSQSKGGFLRRMFNSFFQHTSTKEESKPRRSFFGLGKKK